MASIRLEGITKRFGKTEVFSNLDLTIQDGEFFTILGPSGCGKSTLLNIIAGLEIPTEGKVYFDQRVVNDLSPKDRDVAMVFQSYALYPHMTVYENIAFPLKMRKFDKKRIKEEVERVAEILGLQGLLHRKPKELSGGQRQRVALGRAIVRRPKVFLMDEPLSNLDARLRVQMRTELKRLHRQLGTTVVYVTHDQSEAMGLSDRIAILEGGVIQQCGTPEEVYFRPQNTFVAGFIGSPAMNIFETEVLSTSPLKVKFGDTALEYPALRDYKRDKILIGIRPEDISVTKEEGLMTAEVDIVEPEGSRFSLDIILNEIKLRTFSNEYVKPGERVYIQFNQERIHLFDPETGKRLFI
jgi:multiple sugar transport system ATP-binding protein